MVIVAVSHLTQGHVYVGFIGGLHAPDVRRWMDTQHTPGENTAPFTLYAVPVASITITLDGPSPYPGDMETSASRGEETHPFNQEDTTPSIPIEEPIGESS